MQGSWQLSLAAKVQGENGTVESKLVLMVLPSPSGPSSAPWRCREGPSGCGSRESFGLQRLQPLWAWLRGAAERADSNSPVIYYRDPDDTRQTPPQPPWMH
jgi:hypothetical protein